MTTEFTVDEFTINLNLEDKITKGLEKVEKQALAVANRIEQAFERIRLNLPSQNMPRPTTTGGGNRPALNPQRFDNTAFTKANSALINRMMNSSGAEAIRAMQARASIYANAGRSERGEQSGEQFRRNMISINNGLRDFNTNIQNHSQNASNALSRLQSNGDKLSNSFIKMAGTIYMIHRAVSTIENAIERGVERQRGELAMGSAYNKSPEQAIQQQANVKHLSDLYGTNLAEAMQQSAMFRNVLPESISDDVIAAFHEGSTVFARTTGMSPDNIQRMSVNIEKMSASGTNIGKSFNALIQNAPALLSGMVKEKNLSSVVDLRELFKKQGGTQSAKDIIDYMNRYPQLLSANGKSNAENVQNSLQTKLALSVNAVNDSADLFTKGAGSGIKKLMQSVTDFAKNNGWLFTSLGKWVGDLSDKLGSAVNGLNWFFAELDYIRLSMRIWFNQLSLPMQRFISGMGDVADSLIIFGVLTGVVSALITPFRLLYTVLKMLPGMGAAGAGTVAAGAEVGAVTVAGVDAAVITATVETSSAILASAIGGIVAAAGIVGYQLSTPQQKEWLTNYDQKRRTQPNEYQYGQVLNNNKPTSTDIGLVSPQPQVVTIKGQSENKITVDILTDGLKTQTQTYTQQYVDAMSQQNNLTTTPMLHY